MFRLRRFFSYFGLTLRIVLYNVKSAWEYRLSFLFQVGGMALNDVLLICVWVFFFARFPDVNGWTFEQTQLLFAMHSLTFAFAMMVFGGVLNIARDIGEGKLDNFLTQPRSVLWRTLVDEFRLDVLGDFMFALGILTYVCLTQGWIYAIIVPIGAALSAVGMIMVAISFQSIGFWVKRFERASWHYFWAVESPGFYPQNVIVGGLRVLMLTVVPSVWIISFPYYFVQDKSLMYFGLIVAFDIVATAIAITVFRKGLRHYESGSLVTVNV